MIEQAATNSELARSKARPGAGWLASFLTRGILAAALLLSGRLAGHAAEAVTLKDAFRNDFSIGVALNQRQFTGRDTNGVALILEQFNAISPENILKWASVHPRPGPNGYDFSGADEYVAFGEKHHMLIVGHTLAWHNQTPAWVFCDDSGRALEGTNPADRALLLQRLHDHIDTVVGRYRGRIKIWDVVNEALSDSNDPADTNMLRRSSPWVRILGAEFIVKAFEWAHQADPDAILRYNDYSIENAPKRRRLVALIKMLQAQGVPVMAIGSQTHATLNWPSPELEDAALTEIAKLGLPIHISELDVNAAQGGQRNQSADVSQNAGAGTGGIVDAANQKQAGQYRNLFRVFVQHRNDIKLVTFWGLTDRDSWRRAGTPLLFDGHWQPKPAFAAVIGEAK